MHIFCERAVFFLFFFSSVKHLVVTVNGGPSSVLDLFSGVTPRELGSVTPRELDHREHGKHVI